MHPLTHSCRHWFSYCFRVVVSLRGWLIAGLIGLISFALIPTAMALPATGGPQNDGLNLLHQKPIEVQVSLGNSANELKFVPNNLEFVAGKRYKLILSNPSTQKHYFTAKDFADGIWSQKVEAGKVEIKGAIHELELKPSAQAEWMFVPIKTGSYKLRCPIPGHAEAGMTGLITVSDTSKAASKL